MKTLCEDLAEVFKRESLKSITIQLNQYPAKIKIYSDPSIIKDADYYCSLKNLPKLLSGMKIMGQTCINEIIIRTCLMNKIIET